MRLKASKCCCTFAWSPKAFATPAMIAAATYNGVVEDDFDATPMLQIRLVDVTRSDEMEMPVLGEIALQARACKVDWSAHPAVKHGVVAVACINGRVYVYDVTAMLSKGKNPLLGVIKSHSGNVRGCQFNQSKPQILTTGGEEGVCVVWTLNIHPASDGGGGAGSNANEKAMEHGHVLEVKKVFSSDQTENEGNTADSSASSQQQQHTNHIMSCAIIDLQWHPKFPHVLGAVTANNTIKVWSLKTLTLVSTLNVSKASHGASVTCLAWNPMEALQLLVGLDQLHPVLQLWDLKNNMAPIRELSAHYITGGVTCVKWKEDDVHQLVSGNANGSTVWWDVTQEINTPLGQLLPEANSIICVNWCPVVPHVLATSSFTPLLCVATAEDEGDTPLSPSSPTTIINNNTNKNDHENLSKGQGYTHTSSNNNVMGGIMKDNSHQNERRGSLVNHQSNSSVGNEVHGISAQPPEWLKRPCSACISVTNMVAKLKEGTLSTLELIPLPEEPLSPRTQEDAKMQTELQHLSVNSPERVEWLRSHHYGLLAAVASTQESRKPILDYLAQETSKKHEHRKGRKRSKLMRRLSSAANGSMPGIGSNNDMNDDYDDEQDEDEDEDEGRDQAEVEVEEEEEADPFDELTEEQHKSYEDKAASCVARGELETAVEICMDAEHYDDAFAIAYLHGGELLRKVHTRYVNYVQQQCPQKRHVLLTGAIASKDYHQLISSSEVAHVHNSQNKETKPNDGEKIKESSVLWKEALSSIIAYVRDGFAEACNELGNMLMQQGNVEGAYACYVCARNIDAIVELGRLQRHSPRRIIRETLLLEQTTGKRAHGAFWAECLYVYGYKLVYQGHVNEAIKYLSRAAEMNHIRAQQLVDRVMGYSNRQISSEALSDEPSESCTRFLRALQAKQQKHQQVQQQVPVQIPQQQQMQPERYPMMSRFNGPVTGTVVPNTPPPGPPPPPSSTNPQQQIQQIQQQQPSSNNLNAPINNMTPMAMRTTPQLMPAAQPNPMQRLMPGQINPMMNRSVERPAAAASNNNTSFSTNTNTNTNSNNNNMYAMYNRPSALMPRAMSTGNAMIPSNPVSNSNTPMANNNFMQPPPLQSQPQGNINSHPPPPPPRLMPHPVSTYSALRATSTPNESGRLPTGSFTTTAPAPAPPPPPPPPPSQQQQANNYNPNMTAMSASTVNSRPSSVPREPQAAYQYPSQPPPPPASQYKVPTPSAQPQSQPINTITEVDLATLTTPLQQQIIARLQELIPAVVDMHKRVSIDKAAIALYTDLRNNDVNEPIQQLLLQFLNAVGTPSARSIWAQLSQRGSTAIRNFNVLRFLESHSAISLSIN